MDINQFTYTIVNVTIEMVLSDTESHPEEKIGEATQMGPRQSVKLLPFLTILQSVSK